jgi:hypothetical protein
VRGNILRKKFETLLVEVLCLRNSDEAIAFDLGILASRPIKKLIRRLFRFECHPEQWNRVFVDGREVFVDVRPLGKDGLVGSVFSIPTDALKSAQETLPVTFHQMVQVTTNPTRVVSWEIIEVFGKGAMEKTAERKVAA